MSWFKRKKFKCFICEKPVGKTAPTIRYKYEGDQIGEVKLCHKCANKLDKSNDEFEDVFDEPF